ncbi:MAG TPA: protein kinase, partial [Acidobacteriota bacterium]|nr:protein kinase [Acidobacteriota bacterium]
MTIKPRDKQRYETRDKLGEGGMGVVYLAYDRVIKRDVALKTIKDINNSSQLDLFYKECELLKALSHPNIIELFDIGVLEEEGSRKPYFVMPLLRGVTLQDLISKSSQRLTLARTVDIITQTCRGLQAAHEAGLIHRDLKPSNIFVMEDDSVKIIDFGIARVADVLSETGWKGTLAYMSPEQIELKPVTPASDIFSLGVVAYEALTRKRPFEGTTERDVATAILHSIPPPVSILNPELSQAVGAVIHKAIAKKPYHRFPTAREFAEYLQKALRNEPIDIFNTARIQPRIQRATKAFEEGDYQFAAEILHELESEGHIDPSISNLRARVEKIVRQKKIQRLIDTARSRFEEGESPLALQKLQEALELDPDNTDAHGLQHMIETRRTDETIQDWFRLARQHIDNYSYKHARQAIENVLALRPADTQARKLLSEIQHGEQEYMKSRQEKEKLFRVAQESWQKGEVSSALSKLEKVLELEHKAPDRTAPERENVYLTFYNEVRSENDVLNNAYAEGRRHLAERNFDKAKTICEQFLMKYPSNALFQALRFDTEEQLRQERSSFIVETDRKVEGEPDLDRRVAILEEALKRYPGEIHFERGLRLMREKRDFVQNIVAKANYHESQGQFVEAIGQWEIVRSIYREYPGLDFELERLAKRRDQQSHSQAKSRWVDQIDQALEAGEYVRALEIGQSAQAEFPDDEELAQLDKLSRDGIERTAEAQRLLAEAQDFCKQKDYEKGVEILRRAYKLDERNPALRTLLADTLAEQARAVIDKDPRLAEDLVQQALELDPVHGQARNLRVVIRDRRTNEYVTQCRARVRQLQANGDVKGALGVVKEAMARLPDDVQLRQLQTNIERNLADERGRDIERLRHLVDEAGTQSDTSVLSSLSARARDIAKNYQDDPEVVSLAGKVQRRLRSALPVAKKELPTTEDSGKTEVLRPAHDAGVAPLISSLDRIAGSLKQWGRHFAEWMGGLAGKMRLVPRTDSGVDTGPVRHGPSSLILALRKPIVWIPGVIVLVALASTPFILRALKKQPPVIQPPVISTVQLSLDTKPAGARVRIDGSEKGNSPVSVSLPVGSHQVDLALPGYQPQSVTLDVTAGSGTSPILYELVPFKPRFRIETETENASVSLDGNPASPIQQGDTQWQNVAQAGQHSLTLSAQNRSNATIEFRADELAVPVVTKLPPSTAWAMVALSSYVNSARIYSNRPSMKVALFSGAQQVPLKSDEVVIPDGLVLDGLAAGTYTVRLGEANDAPQVGLEIGDAPSLSIHQLAQQATAYMWVYAKTESGAAVDGVRILVDGREWREVTKEGKVRISGLDLKEHSFQATASSGYDLIPPDMQRRTLNRGRNEISFLYREPKPAAPRAATLDFMAGPNQVGAQVFVDDKELDVVKSEGDFARPIPPGEHWISLRKEHFAHQRVQKQFKAGDTVRLTDKEIELSPSPGSLVITVNPPSGRVRYRTTTAQEWTTASQNPAQAGAYEARVKPGKYEIEASADGFTPATQQVEVRAGETKPLSFTLRSNDKAFDFKSWNEPGKPARWAVKQDWDVLKGAAGEQFAAYGTTPPTGRYRFLWLRREGLLVKGKTLRWAINLVDEKNYYYFSFDGTRFLRHRVQGAKEDDRKDYSIQSAPRQTYYVIISVTQDGILTEITDRDGKSVLVRDDWKIASYTPSAG